MPAHILIVDDEENIREMARLLLEKKGYSVATAENGAVALAILQKQRPDLVLLDVLMPEMDGYTFYKELKKDKITEDIPVLIITARGMMEDAFKVMGVDGFLTKPVLPEVLLEEIAHILEINAIHKSTVSGQSKPLTKRILLVGRDLPLLDQMAFQSRRLDFESQIASSGSDAIARAVKYLPGIIFIEVQLEDMAAGEIVEILRRLPQFDETPIIGYSYYSTQNLDDPQVRKRMLKIEEASQQLLRCGATHDMGRYNQRLFIQTLKDFAYKKNC